MSNICIIGHISIDKIYNNKIKAESIGGPPCYSGLTCVNEGLDVEIYTKIGSDFPAEYELWLKENRIKMLDGKSTLNTTSFKITETKRRKQLKLINKCEEIIIEKEKIEKYEGIILSPIVNELNKKNNKLINKLDKKILLDPQGYLRKFNENGVCELRYLDINELPKADIIKISEEESKMIDNSDKFSSRLEKISKIYPITIGTTNNELTYLFTNKKCYEIRNHRANNLEDTIGLGDILNGVFFSMYVKNEDILWSISKAIAFTTTREGIGIRKLEKFVEYSELSGIIYNNIKKIY